MLTTFKTPYAQKVEYSPKISIVIPVYNAQKIILNSYKVLKEKLEKQNYSYEILFRDDASSDRSKYILGEIYKTDSKAKVFSNSLNRGLGFTLRNLFRHASGDIIIYLDIDLPFGIDILPHLIQELKSAEVILASRYAGLSSRIPLPREITSRLYYLLCSLLFDINVKDIGSGAVVFRKEALNKLSLVSDGFDIHIEIFAQLKESGCIVKEIPAKYTYNGYSTFSILQHAPSVLINTLRFWLKNK